MIFVNVCAAYIFHNVHRVFAEIDIMLFIYIRFDFNDDFKFIEVLFLREKLPTSSKSGLSVRALMTSILRVTLKLSASFEMLCVTLSDSFIIVQPVSIHSVNITAAIVKTAIIFLFIISNSFCIWA